MKKSPAKVKAGPGVDVKVKRKKTYTRKGSKFDTGGQTTKVYRKDGSLKRETNINYSGKKKVPVTGGNPRFLSKTTVMVDEKVPASGKTTKFNRKGEVKKEISASNKKQIGLDKKKLTKISRQTRRDIKNADKKSPTTMKKSPSKMKSPAKKPLVGKQKNLPEHLKKAILDAPAKMLSKSGMKMMKEGSPAKMSANRAEVKKKKQEEKTKRTAIRQGEKTERVKARKGDASTKKSPNQGKADFLKQLRDIENMKKMQKSPAKMKAPVKKSKQRVEQDYARNAIADYKAGKKKQGNYEKKKALELAAGESGVMMKKSPTMLNKAPMSMKSNQDGGAYAAKNPAAPAKQLKKLGSILSKHMKSR